MYAQSVTIGPEFFTKSFNDYRDKFWAFAREIMQNSLDCGSTTIDIVIREEEDEGRTVVVVGNDGEPMTKDILVNKLLSLGSSGKDFRGAVGGFGKAKEVLYFAHRAYTISSGDLWVSGSGAGYDIEESNTPIHGTRSMVTWEGCVAERLREGFRRFIALCDRRGLHVHARRRVPEAADPPVPLPPPPGMRGEGVGTPGRPQLRGGSDAREDRGHPDVHRVERLQADARPGVAGGQRGTTDREPRQPAVPVFNPVPGPDHADGRGPSLGPET